MVRVRVRRRVMDGTVSGHAHVPVHLYLYLHLLLLVRTHAMPRHDYQDCYVDVAHDRLSHQQRDSANVAWRENEWGPPYYYHYYCHCD